MRDATTTHVLEEVEIGHAARAVIAANRDDTAVLATQTVRQLNTRATVVAAVRHAENAPLLRSAGANAALVTAESAGQLLGVSALSPPTGEIVTTCSRLEPGWN